jgi:RNA polymerase sigma-70 factor, ECF subfamily
MATHPGLATELELDLEPFRRELTGFCYRMLGSGFEAEDAVQETMLRAWRSSDRLTSPAALKAWLHRIATNVCLDMLKTPQRRARPMDLASASAPEIGNLGDRQGGWVMPIADAKVLPEGGDPAEIASLRETLRLAFVAALQHLPPRQRAVLLLRDVLRLSAQETADLLDTSVASANSALQRARATLESLDLEPAALQDVEVEQDVVDKYVSLFESYDIEGFTSLLRDDVQFSMPPYPLWLDNPADVATWMLGPGHGCRGSRVLATRANGGLAFAAYRPDPEGGHAPWSLAVVELGPDGRIAGVHNFLDVAELYPHFGLPAHLG